MKKFLYFSFGILVAIVLSVSCNKVITDTPSDKTPVTDENRIITITASLSDAQTKVNFNLNESTYSMDLTWQEGDKLTVSSATESKEFTLDSSSYGSTEGRFTGELPSGGAPYSIVVVPNGTNPSDYTNQAQSANGTTDHLRYIASAEGVDDLSSTINLTVSSGVLGIIAMLPNGAAKNIKSLTLEASSNIFYNNSNELTITLGTLDTANSDNILKFYATIPAASSIPANTTLFLRFNAPGTAHTVYTRFYEFSTEKDLNVGQFNYLKINCSKTDLYAGPTSSDGTTAAKAYLIADAYQMQALNALLAAKSTNTVVYAELIDDIDLGVIANWIPIDASTRFINLEGNNKTLSNLTFPGGSSYASYYPGLFGVLYGTVQNLTISKASISGGGKSAGALAGYLGANTGYSIGCTIDNVTIDQSTINGNGKVCGALAACIGQHASNTFAIKISNVTVSNSSVTNTNDCGGLLALTQGDGSVNRTLSISNCEIVNSTVSSTGTNIRVGGLVGVASSHNTTISDIVVKGTNVSGLSKAKAVGGIAGQVSSAVDFDRCTFEKNGETTATVTGPTQHSGSTESAGAYIGGIAGEVSGDATFDDCHVKNATVTFTDPSSNSSYWKYTGGAFGYVHSSGTKIGHTTACTAETVSVVAYHYCGGFVGVMNEGSIKNSTITGLTISGRNYVGGYIGQLDAGSISDCSVAGNTITSANATVGGFAGIINSGSLEGCSTSLNVGDDSHNMATNLGGFAGQVQGGTLNDCHASGNVYASGNYDGGFVGTGGAGAFTNCSSRGTIKGNSYVGGFVGQAVNESFTDCSYEGTSITGVISNKNGFIGGFVGRAPTTASSFTNCHVGGGPAVTISSSAAQRCGGFVGQLDGLNPVTSFSKCYVKNVNISGPANTGGFVGVQYGPIDNCWVEGGSVTSVAGGNTGGFSAFVQSSGATANLTNCYTTANVNGASYNNIGGFIGIANNSAYTVQYCYSTGTVSGSGSNIGGFVGNLSGSSITVDKCISWNSSLALYGADGGATLTDNYVKATSETGTVSSRAQESPRSWSSTTWNFTGDLPTLR